MTIEKEVEKGIVKGFVKVILIILGVLFILYGLGMMVIIIR